MQKSISLMAKEEVSVPLKRCCAKAFLSALFHSIGTPIFTDGDIGLKISSSNARLLRLTEKLVREFFDVRTEIHGKTLSFLSSTTDLMIQLDIIADERDIRLKNSISPKLYNSKCCLESFCKGVFLASGSVVTPKGGGYNLEFSLTDNLFARQFTYLLNDLGLPAKLREKGQKARVYLKSADSVCDFLALIGAGGTVLYLNSLAAERQMRQIANRNENCDLANIEKTVAAATSLNNKLVGILDKIDNPELRRTAELRLTYPEATYAELARQLGISKSGLTHRLKKLETLADSLTKNFNDK